MKTYHLFKTIALTLVCAARVMLPTAAEARVVTAHAGTTFETIISPGNPTTFVHDVNGVVRVSLLGNCTVHFDVAGVFPSDPTDPNIPLIGTILITSADTKTTLKGTVEGTLIFDQDNPGFGDFHYNVAFTGGTGKMKNATGRAVIDGFALLTEATPLTNKGKATWLLRGKIDTESHGDSHENDD